MKKYRIFQCLLLIRLLGSNIHAYSHEYSNWWFAREFPAGDSLLTSVDQLDNISQTEIEELAISIIEKEYYMLGSQENRVPQQEAIRAAFKLLGRSKNREKSDKIVTNVLEKYHDLIMEKSFRNNIKSNHSFDLLHNSYLRYFSSLSISYILVALESGNVSHVEYLFSKFDDITFNVDRATHHYSLNLSQVIFIYALKEYSVNTGSRWDDLNLNILQLFLDNLQGDKKYQFLTNLNFSENFYFAYLCLFYGAWNYVNANNFKILVKHYMTNNYPVNVRDRGLEPILRYACDSKVDFDIRIKKVLTLVDEGFRDD